MSGVPLGEFFGPPVVEVSGWRVYVGRAGAYATANGVKGFDLVDRVVPDAVRAAYDVHLEQTSTAKAGR